LKKEKEEILSNDQEKLKQITEHFEKENRENQNEINKLNQTIKVSKCKAEWMN